MCNFSLKLISLGSKLPRLISRIQFALQDVFEQYGEDYRQSHWLSMTQHKTMNAILNCRNRDMQSWIIAFRPVYGGQGHLGNCCGGDWVPVGADWVQFIAVQIKSRELPFLVSSRLLFYAPVCAPIVRYLMLFDVFMDFYEMAWKTPATIEVTGVFLRWCGRRDLNPHGCPPDPKSGASASSATPALQRSAGAHFALARVSLT